MRSGDEPQPVTMARRPPLRDFRTDSRMLVLVALAVPIGVVSAVVAKVLLWLIAELTNLVFFQRFSSVMPPLENHHLGPWVIAARPRRFASTRPHGNSSGSVSAAATGRT